jgi:hypothetical protein
MPIISLFRLSGSGSDPRMMFSFLAMNKGCLSMHCFFPGGKRDFPGDLIFNVM